MATAVKRKLSASTNGRGIKVAATSSPGTTIHTAVSGTTPGTFDEIWLFAQNNHTSDILLTLEFGGTTNPDDNINVTISSKAGLMLIVPGLILQNECVVKAYAASGNYIVITGFVNSITD